MVRHSGIWLIVAFALVLVPLGCQFDTTTLDQRRCTLDNECADGYRCIDKVCQGIPPDLGNGEEPDLIDQPEVDPCHDYDNDGVFAGAGCAEAVIDCNDFDPNVFPQVGTEPGADEVCDGKDNDCDGDTDTDDANYAVDAHPCQLTEGECRNARRTCLNGIPQDCPASAYGTTYEAGDELTCDNKDNDCDGTTDEDISEVCYTGASGTLRDNAPCAQGLKYCEAGEFVGDCVGEVVPQSENTYPHRCDGIDNNCDGAIDEECVCHPGDTRACYPPVDQTTADHPPCRRGVQTCGNNYRWGECDGWVGIGDETCANPGIDNDCDGDIALTEIDGWGDSCTDSGVPGECSAGTKYCVGTTLTCVPGKTPTDETCANQGTDNDCDGNNTLADIPGFAADCYVETFIGTAVEGECRNGVTECDTSVPSQLICRPSNTGNEVCDTLDNDCDGAIDEVEDAPTEEDENNCGACFAECESPTGTCCDSGCRNTQTDVHYCGSCAGDCDGCIDCTDLFVTLDDPGCCSGACKDLDDDVANCGSCGNSCTGDTDTCCGGGCVDKAVDINNCGECGHACSAGTEQCCNGKCVAKDDIDHCGGCGEACTAAQSCCAADTSFSCTSWDKSNCGECGFTCPTDANWACLSGGCVDLEFNFDLCGTSTATAIACTPGTDEACCTGVCTDFDTPADCGFCDHTCTSEDDDPDADDWACINKTCVDRNESMTYCGSTPTNCATVSTCPNGNPDCILPLDACCGGTCADLNSDEANCGECGNVCPTDVSGQNWECCDGFCVDILSNLDYCGACSGTNWDECNPTQGELCTNGDCVGP